MSEEVIKLKEYNKNTEENLYTEIKILNKYIFDKDKEREKINEEKQ